MFGEIYRYFSKHRKYIAKESALAVIILYARDYVNLYFEDVWRETGHSPADVHGTGENWDKIFKSYPTMVRFLIF